MSVLDGSDTGIVNRSKRTYVAVATATTQFYSYTVAMNTTTFVNTGTLTGSAATVVAGTLLRENGKKLYPDANPGVTKYLVGVYLTESPFTSGFIDPNSGLFVVYNSDKPTYLGGSASFAAANPALPSLTTTNLVTAGTGVVATTGQIRAATITAIASGTSPSIDISLGQVFTFTCPAGAPTFTISNPANGASVYLIITHLAGDTNARVITFGSNIKGLGTLTTGSAGGEIYTLEFISDGTSLLEISRTAVYTDTT
jgi:hypothetical protein